MAQAFFGGVHPNDMKAATNEKAIEQLSPPPAQVVIPMSLHFGAPCTPIVSVGDYVKVGQKILEALNLKQRQMEIVSCPGCGRAQVDIWGLANDVTDGLEGLTAPLRIAVMGCVVNGPGEAREADLGVAAGNGKGQIFIKGEVIKTVPESEIVATLIEEANRLAADMEHTGEAPQVTVV